MAVPTQFPLCSTAKLLALNNVPTVPLFPVVALYVMDDERFSIYKELGQDTEHWEQPWAASTYGFGDGEQTGNILGTTGHTGLR
jgi:hypothetical protein